MLIIIQSTNFEYNYTNQGKISMLTVYSMFNELCGL